MTSIFLKSALLSALRHRPTPQHVRVRRSVHSLPGQAFASRRRRVGDLPVLACYFSASAGSQTWKDRTATRDSRPSMLPSPSRNGAGGLIRSAFRSSITRPIDAFDLRFEIHLTMCPAKLEVKMESLSSFPLGILPPLQSPTTCRLIPALSEVP